jgi:hypothetical protein
MRLEEAIEEIIRNSNGMTKLDDHGVSLSEVKSLKKWYSSQAEVQMVMFNIGDVHDANSNQAQAFTTIFWNQFNAQRGYNSFNLALAQYLEKALDDDGKFEEFKDYVKGKGYDWERNISRLQLVVLTWLCRWLRRLTPHWQVMSSAPRLSTTMSMCPLSPLLLK